MWQVPDLRSSAVHRALAAELRRLRERTAKSGDEVAGELRWSASKVSRIETNKTGVKLRDLNQLLNLYEVDDGRRRQLIALASEPEPRGWWSAFADAIGTDYAAYVSLEDSAASLSCWSPELVHGLLQTEDYAGAIMQATYGDPPSISPGEIQRFIEVRLRRQELLAGPAAKQMTFILDESTLHRRFGSPGVMRGQLAHLDHLSRLPNVTVRVLSFAGAHPATPGGFTLLDFVPVHGTDLGDVVYVEHFTRSNLFEEEHETYDYRLAFGRLAAEALDPAASRQLIAAVTRERWP
jgi:transcriptional regulator with XRE-family HTH domain